MKYKGFEINQTSSNRYQCYVWSEEGERAHWHAFGEEHPSVAAAKRWINAELPYLEAIRAETDEDE